MEQVVVVLGMHRSGTSLVAGVVHTLGVPMLPSHVDPDSQVSRSNIRGHFEDKRFVRLHDKLLRLGGGSWDRPPAHERLSEAFEQHLVEVQDALRVRSSEAATFGFKDPRAVLFLPCYRRLLQHARYIVVHRNQTAIALSLKRRDGIAEASAGTLARRYAQALEEHLEVVPETQVCHVDYHELVATPAREVERLASFLQVVVPREVMERACSLVLPADGVRKERRRYIARKLLHSPGSVLMKLLGRSR